MKKTYMLAAITSLTLTACFIFSRNTPQTINNNTAIALQPGEVKPQNIVFPKDSGVINVKDAPYNAKGDGVTDDTAAIQKALSEYANGNKIIYLPKGTYLVSDKLKWPSGRKGLNQKRTILHGENRTQTIIKLKDNSKGFTNPNKSKAMIWTGKKPAQRFRNAIRNLTVNTGKGNRGAIAIQFIANNQGTIRDVTIKSGDGFGVTGLDMGYTDEIGPLLVKNVRVIGFKRGIKTGHRVNSQTFENIALENQREHGFYNRGQVVSIRNLTSINTVPAVYNDDGFITLLNAKLTAPGKTSTTAAITNNSTLFARNINTSGYKIAIKNNNGTRKNAVNLRVKEFVSHPIHKLFPTPSKSLNLPIQKTPDVPWDNLKNWVSPTNFGAKPNDKKDDSAAIQKAIDSRKTTVYFPNGKYKIDRNIYIRGNVRRIIGLEASIGGRGKFNFSDGKAPVVVLERLDGVGSGIVHASSRTLVLSSMGLATSGAKASYSNTGSGNLFLEDVVGGPWKFKNQKVWARQLNPENPTTKILNNGGRLWVLGLKTEREGIIIDTKNKGKTEVAGGFIYSTSKPKKTPIFTNDNSSISISVSECNFNGNPFKTLIRDKKASITKILNRGNTPQKCNGSVIPLYVSY
ncbi:MAG: glycosyl hydrolase family 28-related protein [Cyanobacteriota bacterium]|nr:glycosyl hydrolase family 28-related protein [Cyanobacteriota bacterium]